MAVTSAGRRALRWGLWVLLGWVFMRGVISFLPPPPARAAEPQSERQAAEEPAGLRAMPEMFTREYLTWSPGGMDDRAARLAPYLAQGLDRQAGWAPADDDAGQQAEQTWVYGVKSVSPTRWLVTIAARVVPFRNTVIVEKDKENKEVRRTERQALPPQTLFLAVPVGKVQGGWVVYDFPSLVPAPEPAAFQEPRFYGQETSDQGGKIRALLTDFFKAYLGGGDITYYLASGVQLRSVRGSWTFQQVSDLKVLKADDGTWAVADVGVQDNASKARYTYRYTVKLADRDGRWYIAELQQKGE